MKKSMKIAVGSIAGLFLASALVSPAAAYPPGQAMTITLSNSQMVAVRTNVTVTVSNARQGSVRIRVGTKNTTTVANSSFIARRVVAPSAAGIYTVTATASDESASKTLYVPSASIPTRARFGVRTYVTVRYAKPGTVVTVTTPDDTFTKTVAANGKVLVPYSTGSLGANAITVTLGNSGITFNGTTTS